MTLIEMLVVLAIIAVTAGVSVLAIGAGSGAGGRAEAARLASRIQLAADRSMIEDTSLGFAPAQDSYTFVEWNPGKRSWQPSAFARLGERHRLPSGMTIAADDARPVLPLGADTSGLGYHVTLAERGRRWTIGFDGMTARLQPELRPTAGSGE